MIKRILVLFFVVVAIGVGVYFVKSQDSRSSDIEKNASLDTPSDMTPKIEKSTVEYTPGVNGYLAVPSGDGQYPGLILIHEWWGLNDDIRSIANRFAENGYLALAVDLYDGESTTDPARARELSSAVREDVGPAFQNLEAALTYLKNNPHVMSDNLASVGWCFGGGWAYQMAVNDLDIDASVMYYGQFNPDDDFSMMKADILGHFGEEDAAIAIDSVREFQAALATANGEHEVFIYPNVGHGFANVRGGNNLAYSEEEAEIAWQRTLEFLQTRFTE